MAMLLQLSLCVLTVIQLTSSQSTYDVTQQENDANSCGSTERMFNELMTAVSLMDSKVSQMQTAMSQLRDVTELKACCNLTKDVKGMLKV